MLIVRVKGLNSDVRLLTTLSVEERQELLALMEGHRPNERELFRQWLRHPVAGMYAVIVRAEGRLAGFAAASLNAGWRMGMVGVYVHPTFRGKGLARKALDELLRYVAELPAEERPEYFCYEEDKARLFRPPIERHEFKDVFAHQQEHQERHRRATSLSP